MMPPSRIPKHPKGDWLAVAVAIVIILACLAAAYLSVIYGDLR